MTFYLLYHKEPVIPDNQLIFGRSLYTVAARQKILLCKIEKNEEKRRYRKIIQVGNIGHKSIALKERQQGCSVEVIAYADKANERLRRRFYKMTLNKGINRNVAATAIARELACFMWGMATGNIGQI